MVSTGAHGARADNGTSSGVGSVDCVRRHDGDDGCDIVGQVVSKVVDKVLDVVCGCRK